jgi:uncharacterized lipoprotein YddW (UPF0748 family)
MRPALLALGFSLSAATAAAAVIDGFAYKDDAALAKAWVAGNPDSSAPALRSAEGSKFARFDLPYSRLKDWRFTWDLEGSWDLAQAERVIIKLRSGPGAAPGQAILYARSGEGWYRLPAFNLTPQWREVALEKSQAAVEGQPSGWAKVDAWRLSILPGQGGDTYADVARIQPQSQLPEAWVWQVGGARNKEQCFSRILKGLQGRAYHDARSRLSAADGILSQARRARLKGDERRQALQDARAKVAEAYALGQKPLGPGLRGAWVHHGDGTRARGGHRAARWKDAIPAMHAMGLNAVLPNVLWSGVAYYPSKLVTVAPGVAEEGDYLQEILDAAKPLGMQVHAWKVMWQFAEGWLAPAGVSQPFREQGRLQKDLSGKEQPWLCPCDERNRQYELDALLEVAAYPIDGVHLDYIRHESPESGFGDACRELFEAWAGVKVAQWPADCGPNAVNGEAYGDFKRDLISTFVRDASAALRQAKPGLTISAAVFSYPELARRQVFQDWALWVREGWVDWVAPMTYTEDAASFDGATSAQAALVGAAKLRPGLQVIFDGGRVLALDSLVDQLKAAAAQGAPGAVLFEWREHLQDGLLPYIRNGLWREGAYDLRLREVPADQLPPKVEAGQALELPAGAKSLLIDDFEDGNLVNALRAPWSAEADSNNLGTKLEGLPLRLSEPGASGSKHALGLRGHFGRSQAPWPYAMLATAFNPGRQPSDLRPFTALRFKARGDGKALELVLRRKAVTDYGDFRASVILTDEWRQHQVALADFAQPGWAQPVAPGFADATVLIFQPGGRDDEAFWFEIDDVELLR